MVRLSLALSGAVVGLAWMHAALQHATRGFGHSHRRRLADESGIALVMALGMMLTLSVLLALVVFVTTAGSQDAEAKNAGQKAYALAEAGLNSAFAQLAPHYPSSSTAGSAAWVASPGAESDGGGTGRLRRQLRQRHADVDAHRHGHPDLRLGPATMASWTPDHVETDVPATRGASPLPHRGRLASGVLLAVDRLYRRLRRC